MADKLLVVILCGPVDEARARQGLRFALHTRQSGILSEVELLLFGPGVSLLDASHPWFADLEEAVEACRADGMAVAACMANAKQYRVTHHAERLGVKLLGAQVLIAARIKDGWSVMSF